MQEIYMKSPAKLSFTRCKKDFLLQVDMRLKNKSKLSSMINQSLNPRATGDFYILLHKMEQQRKFYILCTFVTKKPLTCNRKKKRKYLEKKETFLFANLQFANSPSKWTEQVERKEEISTLIATPGLNL